MPRPIFLLPALLALVGACSAEPGSALDLTIEGGKADQLTGTAVSIWPQRYDWLEFGNSIERNVRLYRYEGSDRIQLDGDAVQIDFSSYAVPVPHSPCASDDDCGAGESCDAYADQDGQCMRLDSPSGDWSLRADGDTETGFVLYARVAIGATEFLPEGALVECGGQNVFHQIDFSFYGLETTMTIDGSEEPIEAADCGLDFPKYVRRDMVLSAMPIPMIDAEDVHSVSGFGRRPETEYPSRLTLEAR